MGNTNLADEEGRGQPLYFDNQGLLAAMAEDESLTTRIPAHNFNVNQSTIVANWLDAWQYLLQAFPSRISIFDWGWIMLQKI